MEEVKLERNTVIGPAYDKTHEDPEKNYGIGGMKVVMTLTGPKGAVGFAWTPSVFLPETYERLAREGKLDWKELSPGHWFSVTKPMGYDVGYHSPKPMHEGQEVHWPTKRVLKNPDHPKLGDNPTREEMSAYFDNIEWQKIGDAPPNCDLLGVPCYCDGSAMRAEEWFDILVREGSDKIWELLEAEYHELFDDKEQESKQPE